MQFGVIARFHNLKVLWSVVVPHKISVMYDLIVLKISAQHPRRDQTMF
jgi:hypothetical protein